MILQIKISKSHCLADETELFLAKKGIEPGSKVKSKPFPARTYAVSTGQHRISVGLGWISDFASQLSIFNIIRRRSESEMPQNQLGIEPEPEEKILFLEIVYDWPRGAIK